MVWRSEGTRDGNDGRAGWTGGGFCPDPLRITGGMEVEVELSATGRRRGRGGASPEIGDCVSGSSVATRVLEEMERGGIGGASPAPSLSLRARLKELDELALDLPKDS